MRIKTLYFENVISDILDLGQLCHGEEDVRKVLGMMVEKISKIMQSDVCSLYLLDLQTHELVLKATKGLNQESVDQIRLPLGHAPAHPS